MRKKHIAIVFGVLTVFFTAGLLLFPQLKNGGEKSAGYALARTPSKKAVPVAVALATTEPFTETLEALGTASANESVVITPPWKNALSTFFLKTATLSLKIKFW